MPRNDWSQPIGILFLCDPYWTRTSLRRTARFGLLLIYVYVGILLVLLALENFFLFPGYGDRGWENPPPHLGVQDVEVLSDDGNTIHAWWIEPPNWTPQRGAVLYAHGNGGNLSMRWPSMERWCKEIDRAVMIFDYPGYGRSTGKPTEANCYVSTEAAHRWLVESRKVAEGEIILLGSSLGAAMVVDLATHRDCRMLVLCAPFTSFPDMAQLRFPFLPARLLVKNRLDNLAKIRTVNRPVFIVHGTADPVVPHWMGEKLYEAANEPKRFLSLPGGVHYHPDRAEFYEAVRDFMRQTEKK